MSDGGGLVGEAAGAPMWGLLSRCIPNQNEQQAGSAGESQAVVAATSQGPPGWPQPMLPCHAVTRARWPGQ